LLLFSKYKFPKLIHRRHRTLLTNKADYIKVMKGTLHTMKVFIHLNLHLFDLIQVLRKTTSMKYVDDWSYSFEINVKVLYNIIKNNQ